MCNIECSTVLQKYTLPSNASDKNWQDIFNEHLLEHCKTFKLLSFHIENLSLCSLSSHEILSDQVSFHSNTLFYLTNSNFDYTVFFGWLIELPPFLLIKTWIEYICHNYLLLAAAAAVASVVSNSVRPHRRQPTRLPHPWDSPGKNTEVGCHSLLQWQ